MTHIVATCRNTECSEHILPKTGDLDVVPSKIVCGVCGSECDIVTS